MREDDSLERANAKIEQLENVAVKEVKEYAQEVKQTKIDLYDNKPFIPKIMILIGAFSCCFLSFGLYIIFKEDEQHKWTCPYFLFGSIAGLIYKIVKFCFF